MVAMPISSLHPDRSRSAWRLRPGRTLAFPDIYLVEEIFAKMWGGDMLTKWGTGEIAWDSPEVKAAFEAFGKIGTKDEMVYPSIDGALTTNIAEGVIPLYQDPPLCTYYSFGEYTQGFIKQNYPGSHTGDRLRLLPAACPESGVCRGRAGIRMDCIRLQRPA